MKDAKPAFEKAWDNWDTNRDDPSALDLYREARDAWVDTVLRDVIGWKDSLRAAVRPESEVRSPDYTVTVRPDGALVHGDADRRAGPGHRPGRLAAATRSTTAGRLPRSTGWRSCSAAAGVTIGVVTDGRWWAVVSARPQTMVASGIVDARPGSRIPATRNAFIELLRRRRLIGGRPEDRLTELFEESVAAAEEITEALGTQVRRAVELLVQALSEAALTPPGDGVPRSAARRRDPRSTRRPSRS